ncbi:MAG: T9SS type A sorting domain-containing protein [Bacteroidetes bacterium]|nr:T9SS type A sorting domain-containing protein [Bacteroidota bacterium]
MPNNPDYDLGPVPGSICDSLSVQISEHLPETSFTLYPNPAFDKVHLHFSSPSTEKITIKILDIKGSLIFQEEINSVDSELDLSKIYNGVYFVKVEGEKLYPVIRLVKIN